jgi:Short C-terminal domain
MFSGMVLWLGSSSTLLAQAAPGRWQTRWDPEILTNALILVGLLLLGAIVIAFVGRWRRQSGSENPYCPSASEQLAEYRSLYEEGVISQEEFERLRAMLGGQIRRSLDMPARKVAQASKASATSVTTAHDTNVSEPPAVPGPAPSESPVRSPEPPQTGIRPG